MHGSAAPFPLCKKQKSDCGGACDQIGNQLARGRIGRGEQRKADAVKQRQARMILEKTDSYSVGKSMPVSPFLTDSLDFFRGDGAVQRLHVVFVQTIADAAVWRVIPCAAETLQQQRGQQKI